jgi:ketosteroid isomerase-like protein
MATDSVSSSASATTVRCEERQFLAAYFRAVEQHDLPGFLSCFLEGEGLTLFEDKETYDWHGFAAFAEGFFQEVSEIAFSLERCLVDPLTSGAAVATGIFTADGKTRSGDAVAIRNAFTFVLIKDVDRWKVKHAHESSLLS